MFKLDNAFLVEVGLGALSAVEKNKMLNHILETLEMRVGTKLAEQMSNEQLNAFEAYINAKDEAGALKWLEANFPNYKQVVSLELDRLKTEIKQAAPQIVAQSGATGSAPVQTQVQQQPQATAQPQQPHEEQVRSALDSQQPTSVINPTLNPTYPTSSSESIRGANKTDNSMQNSANPPAPSPVQPYQPPSSG